MCFQKNQLSISVLFSLWRTVTFWIEMELRTEMELGCLKLPLWWALQHAVVFLPCELLWCGFGAKSTERVPEVWGTGMMNSFHREMQQIPWKQTVPLSPNEGDLLNGKQMLFPEKGSFSITGTSSTSTWNGGAVMNHLLPTPVCERCEMLLLGKGEGGIKGNATYSGSPKLWSQENLHNWMAVFKLWFLPV